jgi:uncharacterized protein (DUF305 family)
MKLTIKSFFRALALSVAVLTGCDSKTTSGDDSHTAHSDSPAGHTDSTSHASTAAGGASATSAADPIMGAMHTMMDQMKAMTMSGDPDHDFTMMMIEHHRGAIQMSDAEARAGKDTTMKAKAESISAKQTKEIEKINGLMQKLMAAMKGAATKPGAADFQKGMTAAMEKMQTDMGQMKSGEDIDHQFASLMIIHHQGAIDMAETELAHGTHEEAKSVAKQTITDSKKDMEELKAWLSSHPSQ